MPPETIAAFAARCASADVRFVLNLAPVVSLAASTLRRADPLIVNEGEAIALLDRPSGAARSMQEPPSTPLGCWRRGLHLGDHHLGCESQSRAARRGR
ncbi:hypothetical protein E1202_09560 [Saccharopolyspora karakumensis]|uniref:PfkB family carbohydrate kinase n=1 Tax=Saccharopolyspora karakumensis TaxID=2530386 RepID=A0A4V2YXM3_9PSEU|nr:hypothetical protein [Saccharopolyspora karakumensis]TDD89997.1 hypothetical protein E1202_09560 [Saccharopolyspora karakumensis]